MNESAGQPTAPPAPPAASADASSRYLIIVGFGLSGRAAANTAIEQGAAYVVIETNAATVERCGPGGLNIIEGDARDVDILRQAGIDRATDIAVTIPGDDAALEVVEQARRLNPTARIVVRCTFVSGGMEAARRGADDTVIAEQVVATEFERVIAATLKK